MGIAICQTCKLVCANKKIMCPRIQNSSPKNGVSELSKVIFLPFGKGISTIDLLVKVNKPENETNRLKEVSGLDG